jgi:hypothetical protein
MGLSKSLDPDFAPGMSHAARTAASFAGASAAAAAAAVGADANAVSVNRGSTYAASGSIVSVNTLAAENIDDDNNEYTDVDNCCKNKCWACADTSCEHDTQRTAEDEVSTARRVARPCTHRRLNRCCVPPRRRRAPLLPPCIG